MIKDEKRIEAYLAKKVKEFGQMCIKIDAYYHNGLPDRLCTLGCGGVVWVEVKAHGERPRPLQLHIHKKLRGIGQAVETVSNKEEVDELIKKYYGRYVDEI